MKHKILVMFEVDHECREYAEEVVSRIMDQFDGPIVYAWIADEDDIVDGKAEMTR